MRNATVENNAIVDCKIDAMAFRIYCYLLSKDDEHYFYNKDIQKALNIKDSKTIAKYMRQLEHADYILRERAKDENGKLLGGYKYKINYYGNK